MDKQTLPAAFLPDLNTEGARKKPCHLPVFSWKGFDCILPQLLSEVLASNHFMC